jgi:Pyridine nucleotide-disulphide oxidoreductase
MPDQSFDLVIIGGGPGGYVTAIRAAQLGMKTALVEREHLGGICLNWGCIPTKALLRTSEIAHLLQHLPEYGFDAVKTSFDIEKVVKRSRAVAKQLSGGVAHLLRKNKVTVFDGAGTLAGKQTVAVTKDDKPVAPASGDRGRWQADLDLQGSHGAHRHAEIPAGHRLGRDRDRIRQLLQRHGRQGDRRRNHGPHPAGGGRRNLRLRP